MSNLEVEYRRFQDFGLIVGTVIVVTLVACALRYACGNIRTLLIVTRLGFYLMLAWNLAGIRVCLIDNPPIAGNRKRTSKELTIAIGVVLIATLLGGLCFELV